MLIKELMSVRDRIASPSSCLVLRHHLSIPVSTYILIAVMLCYSPNSCTVKLFSTYHSLIFNVSLTLSPPFFHFHLFNIYFQDVVREQWDISVQVRRILVLVIEIFSLNFNLVVLQIFIIITSFVIFSYFIYFICQSHLPFIDFSP